MPAFTQMAGGPQVLNMGLAPNMKGFPQNGQQPIQKKDRAPTHSLYIGNLSNKTYDLDLYKFFTSKGYKVQSAKVMFQQETSRSKGFGYLNFNDQEEAERCLSEMNNAVIDSKAIVLNKKKDSDFDTKANLIVKNLPKEMTQKELNELFTQFGQIGSCKLETFQDGQSRCFGYVQYIKEEDAKKAIDSLNGFA